MNQQKEWVALLQILGVEKYYTYYFNDGIGLWQPERRFKTLEEAQKQQEIDIEYFNKEYDKDHDTDCNVGTRIEEVICDPPTADTVLALEELMFNKFCEWQMSNYDNKYQYEVSDGYLKCNGGIGVNSSAPTRLGALCLLIIKLLDAGVLSVEDVREVVSY